MDASSCSTNMCCSRSTLLQHVLLGVFPLTSFNYMPYLVDFDLKIAVMFLQLSAVSNNKRRGMYYLSMYCEQEKGHIIIMV